MSPGVPSGPRVTRPVHVLLVEDDPLTVLNVRRLLLRTDEVATVTVAVDGREALDLLLGGTLPRDRMLVITDLSMPRMSGLELLYAIRRDAGLSHLPVVVLMTSSDGADRQAAFALQVAGYFVKAHALQPLQEMMTWLRGYWSAGEFAPG
jgi:CheY-like chemotaxis protein